MTEHRKLISWLESSFVCNWRMLVWHIGDWQLRERLGKSCCKKQPPLHFSTRDTCCCCRGKHLNIFRKGESLSLFPNGYLKLFWIKSRKTFTAVMEYCGWSLLTHGLKMVEIRYLENYRRTNTANQEYSCWHIIDQTNGQPII